MTPRVFGDPRLYPTDLCRALATTEPPAAAPIPTAEAQHMIEPELPRFANLRDGGNLPPDEDGRPSARMLGWAMIAAVVMLCGLTLVLLWAFAPTPAEAAAYLARVEAEAVERAKW